MAFGDRIPAAFRLPAAVSQITSRDLLNICFFYRRVAVAIFAGFTVLGFVIACFLPPAYTAEARLLVLYGREYQGQGSDTGGAPAPGFETTEINDVEAEILASRELHRAVVTAQADGAALDPAELDRRLDKFERQFRIEKVDTANVLDLSFVDSNPQRAADTLNTLLSFYFAQRAGIFTSGRESFLIQQRDKAKSDLDAADAALVAFRQTHGIANIDDQINAAVALDNLTLQHKLDILQSIAQDEASLAELQKQSSSVPEQVPLFSEDAQAQASDSLQATLVQLEARRADLASRYKPTSQFVTQIDQQIKEVKATIAAKQPVETTRTGRNTLYDTVQDRIVGLRADLAGQHARERQLEDQLAAIDGGLNDLIAISSQLHRMEIDRDLLVDSFRNFMQQLEQARIAQNQDRTVSNANVRIIQAPYPPVHRSNSPLLFFAASMFAGLVTAGVAVMVLSSLRQFFLSPEEAERGLGLPVLAAPFVGSPAAKPGMPVARRRKSDFGRLIAAINGCSEDPTKVILFIASREEDDVAGIIRGLSLDLEQRSSRPVLLLDMHRAANSPYGFPDEHGFIYWQEREGQPAAGSGASIVLPPALAAELDFHPIAYHNLLIARPRADAAMPLGAQAAPLVAAAREICDYVLIHAPATHQSSVGIEYGALADATVIVIRAETTRKPVALVLKEQIAEADGRTIGFALTNRRSYIPKFLYPS